MKLVFAAALVATLGAAALPTTTAPPSILVYKSPSCGCCKAWMDHLEIAEVPREVVLSPTERIAVDVRHRA